MAQQRVVSSLIGADLSADDSSALFALGTVVDTTDGGTYQYVCATGTFTTGYFVVVSPTGTASRLHTGVLTANASGADIGVFQNIVSQGQFGWVAQRGRNLYVLCTGTVTAGGETGVAFSTNTGRLQNAGACGVGNTALGIFITTSASTATASVAVATLTWPRDVLHG